jgi:hypothetical protein
MGVEDVVLLDLPAVAAPACVVSPGSACARRNSPSCICPSQTQVGAQRSYKVESVAATRRLPDDRASFQSTLGGTTGDDGE